MWQGAMVEWERQFRAAAKADKNAILRSHLRRLGLPDSPKLLLEGTVQVVRACSIYTAIGHRTGGQFEEFLELQQYNAADASDAQYAYTFDLHNKAYARILVEPKVQIFDLADVYGNPWNDYEVVGYGRLFVSRVDWRQLTAAEVVRLEEEVTSDLRFDYTDDEIEFWFDNSLDKCSLIVTVQDVDDS